jgi:hypothetical protein
MLLKKTAFMVFVAITLISEHEIFNAEPWELRVIGDYGICKEMKGNKHRSETEKCQLESDSL